MAFGFSVGDFIAALELVGTVVVALRETGGATSQYRELVHELYGLETALLRVKQLEFDENQVADYIALKQVACQCQQTIDAFVKKAGSYQPHLTNRPPARNPKTLWMKIQWSLFMSDDLTRFKADLAAHTQSILILLAAVQMQRLDIQHKTNNSAFSSFRASLQQGLQQCFEQCAQLTSSISCGIILGQEILQNTVKIVQTNLQIFHAVHALQARMTAVPLQIDRQQPVYMIDAIGTVSPFHLEFVRSSEALKAVLKANFEHIPSGMRKIMNGEFVFSDIATGRQIDLNRPWASCFLPGQRVDMRMVFQSGLRQRGRCPACRMQFATLKKKRSENECPGCGVIFKRVIELEEIPEVPTSRPSKALVRHQAMIIHENAASSSVESNVAASMTAFDEMDDIQHYRRVRILQRKRRKVWQIPEAENDETEAAVVDDPVGDTETKNSLQEPPYDTSTLRNVVDTDAFEQILELDDDEVERAFSRSITLGFFGEAYTTLEEARAEVYDTSPMPYYTFGRFYPLKSACASIGLTAMGTAAYEMNMATKKPDIFSEQLFESEDERRAYIRQRYETCWEQFAIAKEKLYAFYKVDPEECCDAHGLYSEVGICSVCSKG